MKKLLLATAMILAVVGVASAKDKAPAAPARALVPSMAVSWTSYEKQFTNEECVANAQKAFERIKKGASDLSINEPGPASVYGNDSELAIMIECIADTKTVVFMTSSTVYKAAQLDNIIKVMIQEFQK